jgi:hypothetical protein
MMNDLTDWLVRNKEWFFSGIGITVGLFILFMLRSIIGSVWSWIFSREKPPVVVRVVCALAELPGQGYQDFLCIVAENHSDREVILGNFMLITKESRHFIPFDRLTGEQQHRRTLRAGDSVWFHISADDLEKAQFPAKAYTSASIETPIGKEYRCDRKQLQKVVSSLLNTLNVRQ